jgi:hypothetical protein
VRVLEAPLDAVSRDARAYPVHLLREGETGLCLFAAAFLGANDAVHMARMGMTVMCVDTDRDRLLEMSGLYPEGWGWSWLDAWQFSQEAAESRDEWDVVSVDTFTGDATDRSLATLDLWCSLARRVVTATVAKHQNYVVPGGWEAALYERSMLADWLVLTRA